MRWSPPAHERPSAASVPTRSTSAQPVHLRCGRRRIALSVRRACSPGQPTHRRHARRTAGPDGAAAPHCWDSATRTCSEDLDRRQPLPSHHPPRPRIRRPNPGARRAAQPDAPDPQSGLHFICLNANIARQFEFIQNAWLMSAKFDGMSGEADPLIGNREPYCRRAIPPTASRLPQPNGISRRIGGMPTLHHGAWRRVFLSAGRAGVRAYLRRRSHWP